MVRVIFLLILSNDIGIAQGCILGPILFMVFINNLWLLMNLSSQTMIKYADDTNLIVANKTLEELITKAGEYSWNKLSYLSLFKPKEESTFFDKFKDFTIVINFHFALIKTGVQVH